MLDLIVESVAQAASNPLAVFCFCNLLIVIILMSPRPSSNFHETSEFHLTVVTHDRVMDEQRIDMEQPPEDEETTPEVMELCVDGNLEKEGGSYNSEGQDGEVMELCVFENLEKEGGSCNSEGQDGEVMELCVFENLEKEGGSCNSEGQDGDKDDGESNNEDDDEFRRRIEAFIDKVNRGWKAERLRTHYLREQEQVDLLVSY
ncbi:hypothetical protein EUGRSUZ_K03335 [Eucalyptus grandis]|uniref:Uncharacterized protein n=2 Tax=Eucalyptus grandis TaxID=71139 RepID=A0ACC3IZ77_EUCGR|nr:hypothetical protein EUGRSUZ_K03335 [Eucalyptus grandis]